VPTAQPPVSQPRVAALDAVRGVAILCVIATHSLSTMVATTGSYRLPMEVFRAFDFGQFGVQLFFVLSGWLMFSLHTGDRPFTKAYYWSRRWARVWPLWVVFLVISYLVFGVPDSGLPPVVGFLLGAFFLGWLNPALVFIPTGGLTIQQEMGHYLLFSWFRRRSVAFLAGVVIVGYLSGLLARVIVALAGDGTLASTIAADWLRLALFNSWPFFLLGGAAYTILRIWRTRGVEGLVPERSWTAVLVGIALLLAMISTYAQETPGYFVLGFVVIAAALAVIGNAIPGVGPALRSIGRYSYFMYFFHFWVLRGIERWYTGPKDTTEPYNLLWVFTIFATATAVSWVVGIVSWNLFEKRILAWAHRRWPAPKAPEPALATG
jgi:peptidoglycan/LPS O-acetylase OafA/YrhL